MEETFLPQSHFLHSYTRKRDDDTIHLRRKLILMYWGNISTIVSTDYSFTEGYSNKQIPADLEILEGGCSLSWLLLSTIWSGKGRNDLFGKKIRPKLGGGGATPATFPLNPPMDSTTKFLSKETKYKHRTVISVLNTNVSNRLFNHFITNTCKYTWSLILC